MSGNKRDAYLKAWSTVKEWTPVAVGILAIIATIMMYYRESPFLPPDEVVMIPNGELTDAQEATIQMIVELNKFLVSIPTLLLGAVGFYLKHYRAQLPTRSSGCAFLVALVQLLAAYYFAFQTYVALTSELAQEVLHLYPGRSEILFNIEMEFWATAGATLVLATILLVGHVTNSESSATAS